MKGGPWALAMLMVALTACTADPIGASNPPTSGGVVASPRTTPGTPPTTAPPETAPPLTIRGGVPQAVIATDPGGGARVQATPFALRERNLPSVDTVPPPPDDGTFRSSISPLEGEPLERSTWEEGCPVPAVDLRYLTMSFIGFDGLPHTGEMIVHADYAEGIVGIFQDLFSEGFPIEEMRIVEARDTVPPHFGDTNNTSSFVCRKVTGGSRFSEHASGLALDINPFQNPYIKRQTVIPAISRSFGDREWERDGMIQPESSVVAAFARIGWKWGGDWNSLKDYQHFSHNGR